MALEINFASILNIFKNKQYGQLTTTFLAGYLLSSIQENGKLRSLTLDNVEAVTELKKATDSNIELSDRIKTLKVKLEQAESEAAICANQRHYGFWLFLRDCLITKQSITTPQDNDNRENIKSI